MERETVINPFPAFILEAASNFFKNSSMVISGLYGHSFSSRIALLLSSKRKTVHHRKLHIKFIIEKSNRFLFCIVAKKQ